MINGHGTRPLAIVRVEEYRLSTMSGRKSEEPMLDTLGVSGVRIMVRRLNNKLTVNNSERLCEPVPLL